MTTLGAREELSPNQCLQLLEQGTLGRLVLSIDALPVAIPVGFAVCNREVVVNVSNDAAVIRADGSVVALQSDRINATTGAGWSVLVQGRATFNPPADGLMLPPGVRGDPNAPVQVLHVPIERITGWRFAAAVPEPPQR